LLNIVIDVGKAEESTYSCQIFLGKSPTPGMGRGIIAGRNFSVGTLIEQTLSLPLRHDVISKWQIRNYVFDTNERDFSMALLGLGMIYNHRVPSHVRHDWVTSKFVETRDQKWAHSTFSPIEFKITREVLAGQEIFVSYGDSDWFSGRGIEIAAGSFPACNQTDIESGSAGNGSCLIASPSDPLGETDGIMAEINNKENDLSSKDANGIPLEELKKSAYCITDVYMSRSLLPAAGDGLFASRDFRAGEVVTITPVLVLPRHEVAMASRASHCVLQNYCIASEGVEGSVLLPIGHAAMANHQNESTANLKMRWHFWDEEDKAKIEVGRSLQSLEDEPYGPLDLAFVAHGDIAADEELTVFYGHDWEYHWTRYLAEVVDWTMAVHAAGSDSEESEETESGASLPMPMFRHFIEAPKGMFPAHWSTETMTS
jgi:hypothetical protein